MRHLIFMMTAKLNPYDILCNYSICKSDSGKRTNTKESLYKSNFVVFGSKFNSPYYNNQAENVWLIPTLIQKDTFLQNLIPKK